MKDGDTIVKSQNQILEKLNELFVTVGPKFASKLKIKPGDDPIKSLHTINADQKFSFNPNPHGGVFSTPPRGFSCRVFERRHLCPPNPSDFY